MVSIQWSMKESQTTNTLMIGLLTTTTLGKSLVMVMVTSTLSLLIITFSLTKSTSMINLFTTWLETLKLSMGWTMKVFSTKSMALMRS